jgi:hypothetical protein
MIDKVNQFMQLVQDCKDRLPALAAELQAKDHYTSFEIEQDRDDKPIDFACSINCSFGVFGTYHCGSYVSATHNFDAAANSIREMHAKWKAEDDAKQLKREEDRIKQALYEDYLKQSK